VVLDEKGHPRFEGLQNHRNHRATGPLVYQLFDLLNLDGHDLPADTFCRLTRNRWESGRVVFEMSCPALHRPSCGPERRTVAYPAEARCEPLSSPRRKSSSRWSSANYLRGILGCFRPRMSRQLRRRHNRFAGSHTTLSPDNSRKAASTFLWNDRPPNLFS
jgi:hypothetical protein